MDLVSLSARHGLTHYSLVARHPVSNLIHGHFHLKKKEKKDQHTTYFHIFSSEQSPNSYQALE